MIREDDAGRIDTERVIIEVAGLCEGCGRVCLKRSSGMTCVDCEGTAVGHVVVTKRRPVAPST